MMLKELLWGKRDNEAELEDLEGLLQGALVEVAPRQGFVKALDWRLIHAETAPQVLPAASIGRWDRLLAFSGVFAGLVLLVTGGWIIVARLRAWRQLTAQMD